MLNKNSKLIIRTIGAACIVVAGITMFYQYQYSKLSKDNMVEVVVATKDISVSELINESNTTIELRNKSNLSPNTILGNEDIIGSVATSTIYENESINSERIISKKGYEKLGYRLVSIKGDESNDTFVGYSVKPSDKVDLLYFDENDAYEGSIYLEGQYIFDLMSSNGVRYADRDGNFIPSYALFWVKADIAEDISAKQQVGGYFKLQVHRDKSSIK